MTGRENERAFSLPVVCYILATFSFAISAARGGKTWSTALKKDISFAVSLRRDKEMASMPVQISARRSRAV
jgi:hypothetical protein